MATTTTLGGFSTKRRRRATEDRHGAGQHALGHAGHPGEGRQGHRASTRPSSTPIHRLTADPPPPGTAPETTLGKAPAKKVEAKKSTGKAKVKLKFSATGTAPSFQCTLTKKGKDPKVRACTSPTKYKLKPGKYTFAVAATADGLVDESPATTKFRVVEP